MVASRRLAQALAALGLLMAALVLSGAAAQAANRHCPDGQIPKPTGYGYGCMPSPSPSPSMTPSPTPTPTPSQSTSPPAPTTDPPATRSTSPLPVTGPSAGPIAGAGIALIVLGGLFAFWATMFVRRNRFQA